MRTQQREISTRPAQEADIEKLVEVLGPGVTPEQVRDRWKEHTEGTRRLLLAEIDGEPVGTISVGETRHYRTDSLRALSLDVGVAHREKGVGAALIAYAASDAIRLQFKSTHHDVGITTDDAVRLSASQGYNHLNTPDKTQ